MRSSLVLLALAGCGPVPAGTATAREGDATLFSTQVQPVLARRCAFLGCHGREGMPLALYAVDYLRLRDPTGAIDPSRPILDERALVPAEIRHNQRALAARVDSREARASRLVRLLVPPERGGLPHAGIVVFPREGDPELEALIAWIGTLHAAR